MKEYIQCKECGSEWYSPNTIVDKCPFCGVSLVNEERLRLSEIDSIEKAFAYIYQTCGKDVFYNKNGQFEAIYMDISSNVEDKYRNLLSIFLKEQGNRKILEVLDQSDQIKQITIHKICKIIKDNYFIPEKITHELCIKYLKCLSPNTYMNIETGRKGQNKEKEDSIIPTTKNKKPTEGVKIFGNLDKNPTRGHASLKLNNLSVKNQDKSSIQIGDIYLFGSYGGEKIEWIVLDKEGNKLLLLSKYVLDRQPYNSNSMAVTWKECTLRKWLNREFYNEAFNVEEKNQICETKIYEEYQISEDHVFLLSFKEVEKYFKSNRSRECEFAAYAKLRGLDYEDWKKRRISWSLRTSGYDTKHSMIILDSGMISSHGDNGTRCGVRPALWIETNRSKHV